MRITQREPAERDRSARRREVQGTAGVQSAEKVIRWTTASAVVCVATVAAVVSYDHAYALVRAHGEDGWIARLVPLTVDGLIYSSSMVLLHSARRREPVPRLAHWLLGLGIAATLAANTTHGLGHGPIGAVIAAWPAVALVGSYELLMLIIRSSRAPHATVPVDEHVTAPMDLISDHEPLEVRAAEAFNTEVAAGRIPSIRAIRAQLRVGQPRAQQIRAHLASLVGGRDTASNGQVSDDSERTPTHGGPVHTGCDRQSEGT